MIKTHDLVLLTAAYPFGLKNETFLETEIEVLGERFDRVHVLPSCRQNGLRPTPDNVEIVEMDWLNEAARLVRHRALGALLSSSAARVIRRTVKSGADLRPYLRSPDYLYILARNMLKYQELTQFVHQRNLSDAIFYDYWFENSTIALALLRESGLIDTAVTRAHGFDVYDERWSLGAVPFREAKAHSLDAIFAASLASADYLRMHLADEQQKIHTQHLGVHIPAHTCPPKTEATPLIVTCAGLEPVKRIHLVPEVLAYTHTPMRWIHFGDGPERDRVHEAARRLLDDRVSWELRGQVENRHVLDFYERNHVDAMLSLSASEGGAPVSMMEAQSYGIPVVARGVGGVPEIVTDASGMLLAPDAAPSDVAAALESALDPMRFDSQAVRRSCERRFDARVNHNRFVDRLLALHEANKSGRSVNTAVARSSSSNVPTSNHSASVR
jgi:glycosyltransferase involved in cell wall biosynthesis